MSFRHTFVTEFLYKGDKVEELKLIFRTLEKYGNVEWVGRGLKGLGYFHGVMKDLNSFDTKEMEKDITQELSKLGVRIQIIFEE